MTNDPNVVFEELSVRDTRTGVLFRTFVVARDDGRGAASDAVSARRPLVIISHGSGGSPLLYRSIAMALARRGFIVAAPEHPFNNRASNEHEGLIEDLEDRPRHVTLALDAVLADAKWGVQIDAGKISIVGHSKGGYTALAVLGGIPNTIHEIQHYPQTKLKVAEEVKVTADPRFGAGVLLAPAAGWFLSPGALAKVKVPLMVMTAELDTLTPIFHGEIIKKGVPDPSKVTLKVVKGAGHFSFLDVFPEKMKQLPPAQDPPGFDRVKFHEEMNADIVAFLTAWSGN